MLAVPYSRVSSVAQTSGLGLERQAADPASYCRQRGWNLYDGPGYADAGISAFGGANLAGGALGRFLADLKAGQFGVDPVALLLEDLDRFSRSFPLAVLPVLIDDLLNAGVTLGVMAKGRDINRETIRGNPMELHELLFWLGSAHEFSDKLSRRLTHVQQAKRQRIREGQPVTPSQAPAWISLDEEGRWVLNDYATVIRRLLELASDHGSTVIAGLLNSEGIPSPGQVARDRWSASAKRRSRDAYKPVQWSGASILQVIENPAITGHRQVLCPGHKARERDWQERCALLLRQGTDPADLPPMPARTYEQPQAGYYPSLLSEAEHQALLATIRRRRPKDMGRGDQLRWLGAGLSFCVCGDLIGATCTTRKRPEGVRRDYRLRCRGKHKRSGCHAPGVTVPVAQAALLTRLSAADFLTLLRADASGQQGLALAAAMAEVAAAQAQVDAISAAINAGDIAMANESDPATLRVLARRQAGQETAMDGARQRLNAAAGELQRLQVNRSIETIGAEAQEQIRGLLSTFACGGDTVADRRLVRSHLLRLGLRITVDGHQQRMGLQIGDGPIDWQPLLGAMATANLAEGSCDQVYAEFLVENERELRQRVQEAIRSGGRAWIELAGGGEVRVSADG
ncbi:recombinase family protein [Synechococcus sp. 1G10]|uniref:recombinase family protein n=1 Tax=Synechococcus sp. 1G10 TaxID=2025605 RepID=UPI000B982E39|nr:recombinase family protein [Synechococcus sp. 1G10]